MSASGTGACAPARAPTGGAGRADLAVRSALSFFTAVGAASTIRGATPQRR